MSRVARTLANIDRANPVNWNCTLNTKLVAWWKSLPMTYGNTYEWRDLVSKNHGRLTNMSGSGSGWGGSPAPGGSGSLRFDGTDDRVDLPSAFPATGSNYTFTCWMNPQTTAAYGHVFAAGLGFYHKGSTGNPAGHMTLYTGSDHNNNTGLPANSWSRYACTVHGTNIAHFLNGKPDGTDTGGVGFTPTCIGTDGAGNTEPYKGSLDSIKIYSRALSSAEVAWEYLDERLGCPETLNRLGGSLSAAQIAALLLARRRRMMAAA